jgi:hypothetical protein
MNFITLFKSTISRRQFIYSNFIFTKFESQFLQGSLYTFKEYHLNNKNVTKKQSGIEIYIYI